MQSARGTKHRRHRVRQGPALRLLLVGLAALGCGHLGIDLDPKRLGDEGPSSGGHETGGSSGAGGSETSSGGESGDGDGGRENLGGAAATGGDTGSGGRDEGTGGAGGTGGAPAEPDCSTGPFRPLAMIDTLDVDGDKWGPTITGDRLTLYFAVGASNSEKIYRSTRPGQDQPFGAATEVTELNAVARQGTPFVNYDDTAIYFFRQSTADQTTRNLWYATRASTSDPFANPTALTALNSIYRDHLPWLTKDELTIYFTSARARSNWETDIWRATRTTVTGPFGDLTLVTGLDAGPSEDQSASLSPDGLTLYYVTDGPTSLDVHSATRASTSDDFGPPTREPGLSSPADDTNLSLSADGREIFISSARGGEQELWAASRECD